MKNIVFTAALAIAAIAFGYTNEQHKAELKEAFEMHLQNREYDEAARCCFEHEIVPNAYGSFIYNGIAYAFDVDDEAKEMNLALWKKWNGTGESIQLKYFKFMCMHVIPQNTHLIQETIDKNPSLPQSYIDAMIFNCWNFVKQPMDSTIYAHAITNLTKMSSHEDVDPLSYKLRFAMHLNREIADKICYDEKCFTYEDDNFTTFFLLMMSNKMYLTYPKYLDTLQQYMTVCTNKHTVLKLMKRIDIIQDDFEFSRKNTYLVEDDLNAYIDLLAYHHDIVKMCKTLSRTDDFLDANHFNKAIYYLSISDENYQCLVRMREMYDGFEEKSDEWKTALEKLDVIIKDMEK